MKSNCKLFFSFFFFFSLLCNDDISCSRIGGGAEEWLVHCERPAVHNQRSIHLLMHYWKSVKSHESNAAEIGSPVLPQRSGWLGVGLVGGFRGSVRSLSSSITSTLGSYWSVRCVSLTTNTHAASSCARHCDSLVPPTEDRVAGYTRIRRVHANKHTKKKELVDNV